MPAGFGGAGQIKLASYSGGQFYSASLVPDGAGTFDLVGLMQVDVDPTVPGIQSLPGGPEGFVYIDAANDGFDGFDSMLPTTAPDASAPTVSTPTATLMSPRGATSSPA